MQSPSSKRDIKDLVDFFEQWGDLRDEAVALCKNENLDTAQSSLINWMIFLIDRVGKSDFEQDV